MILLHLAALLSGFVLGWLFVLIWRLFAPADRAAAFWRGLYGASRGVLSSDEVEAMWRHYKTLLGLVGVYTGRNLLGVAAAVLPVALFLFLLAPYGLRLWDEAAPYLEIVPASAAAMLEDRTMEPEAAGRALLAMPVEALSLDLGGQAVTIDRTLARHAFCEGGYCSLFAGLAFMVDEVHAAAVEGYLVLRPSHADINPLWPYLSDLEFGFFIAFCLATLLSFFWHQRRERRRV